MQTNPLLSREIISSELYCIEGRRACLPVASKLKKNGFSLIEVILALGVVSFAFVALFGMLPIGLNAFNNSIDSTVSAQIAENVMTQLKQGKFSQLVSQYNDATDAVTGNLPSFYKTPSTTYPQPATGFYFDDQGNLVAFVQKTPPTGAINPVTIPPTNYVYSAEVQIYYNYTMPAGVQPSQMTSSGTYITITSGSIPPQSTATVVITVRKISTPNAARVFTGYIDNNGL